MYRAFKSGGWKLTTRRNDRKLTIGVPRDEIRAAKLIQRNLSNAGQRERDSQWCLKYCTAFSCASAARLVVNVPRFRRFPVWAFFFREYRRYWPVFSFRIIGKIHCESVANDSYAGYGLLSRLSCDAPPKCAAWRRRALVLTRTGARPRCALPFSGPQWLPECAQQRAWGSGFAPSRSRDWLAGWLSADVLPSRGAGN